MYGGIRNTYEDNTWKRIENAESLMNSGYTINYISNDKDFPLSVVDFNLTSITFQVKITNQGDVGKNIDFLVQEYNENDDLVTVSSIKLNFQGTNIPYQYTFKINPLSKRFKWGTGSTTVSINSQSEVEDAIILSGTAQNLNFGGRTELSVGELLGIAGVGRSLIRFKNISDRVGADQVIDSAIMSLYCYSEDGVTDVNIGAYRVFKNWTEGDEDGVNDDDGDATWNDWRSDDLEWGIAGCNQTNDAGVENSGDGTGDDKTATAEDSQFMVACTGGWYDWNLTIATRNWYNESWSEYGLILISDNEATANIGKNFHSSEYAVDTSLRPYLNITYSLTNLAPITNTSRLYSENNYTNASLEGYCNATDINGDNVSYFYEWYLDGELYSFGSFSNYTGDIVQVSSFVNSSSLWTTSSVFVSGGYAYVTADVNNSLTIINISDKDNPIQIGWITNTSLNGAYDVSVSGNYAFVVASANDSLTIINVSDKTSPTQIGYITNQSSMDLPYSVYVLGDYAYMTAWNNDALTIINVSDKTSPTQTGSLTNATSLSSAINIHVIGDYAYVASYDGNSLTVINISDKTNPTQIGYISNASSLDNILGIYVSGDYAYGATSTNDSLTIIDISDKTNPTQTSSLSNSSSLDDARSVYVSGDYAFVTSFNDDALTIINVSDKSNPTQIGFLKNTSSLNQAQSVYISGNYAFVASYVDKTLTILDIGNGFTEGIEININNITENEITAGTWILSCRASDDTYFSDWLNSSSVTIASIIIDYTYPIFSNYQDNDPFDGWGFAIINVTVINTNGTIFLDINNINYTSQNIAGNTYNATVFLTAGTYNYLWHSWGNGSATNYNVSEQQTFLVTATRYATEISSKYHDPTIYNNRRVETIQTNRNYYNQINIGIN